MSKSPPYLSDFSALIISTIQTINTRLLLIYYIPTVVALLLLYTKEKVMGGKWILNNKQSS